MALEKSNGRQPHPVFGRQLQPRATYSLDADVERVAGFFVGEPRPTVRTLTQTSDRSTLSRVSAHVQGHPDVVLSGRIAPALHGLGLLEAIPEERLIELADPNDTDGDSISGTVHWRKMPSGAQRVGRFGWKAVHPSVAEQTAEAFQQDIGITSQRRLQPNCTRRQAECKVQPTGANEPGSPEIVDDLFDRVVAFTANLAVPAARPVDSRQGRQLFHAANCDGCHVPSHSVEMQNGAVSTIWPYTDLLLHDMGPDLADPVTHGDALLSEWRTAPLWGLGLALRLNQSTGLLHDGRAATVDEAILWHGGEALRSREFFEELSTSERQALVRFVLAL
ncbi:MAG: di-heme oxidoredictase family protein [Pseudomonadota bacterium]